MKKKIAVFITGLLVIIAVYILEVKPRLQAYEYVRNMPIGAVDIQKLADATKEGEYVYTQNGFEMHNEPTYRKYLDL